MAALVEYVYGYTLSWAVFCLPDEEINKQQFAFTDTHRIALHCKRYALVVAVWRNFPKNPEHCVELPKDELDVLAELSDDCPLDRRVLHLPGEDSLIAAHGLQFDLLSRSAAAHIGNAPSVLVGCAGDAGPPSELRDLVREDTLEFTFGSSTRSGKLRFWSVFSSFFRPRSAPIW